MREGEVREGKVREGKVSKGRINYTRKSTEEKALLILTKHVISMKELRKRIRNEGNVNIRKISSNTNMLERESLHI